MTDPVFPIVPAAERRRQPRVHLRWPVRLRGRSTDVPVASVTDNVSRHGFQCCSPESFVAGEVLACTVEIAGGEEPVTLECAVEVIWVEPCDGHFKIGCALQDYSVVRKVRTRIQIATCTT